MINHHIKILYIYIYKLLKLKNNNKMIKLFLFQYILKNVYYMNFDLYK